MIDIIADPTLDNQVTELIGNGKSNGFRLVGISGSLAWSNTTQKNISWNAKFNSRHQYFVAVETTDGFRYLTYDDFNQSAGIQANSRYIKFGIGSDKSNWNWYAIERDRQADLQRVEPNNNIIEVNALLVRRAGSSKGW